MPVNFLALLILLLSGLSLSAQVREISAVKPQSKLEILFPLAERNVPLSVELRFQEIARLSGLTSMASTRDLAPRADFQLIATNSDFSKALFLRTDLRVGLEWHNQLYQHRKGSYVWTTINSKQVSFFFYGFQNEEVKKIYKSFHEQYALGTVITDRKPTSEVAPVEGVKKSTPTVKDYALEMGESFLKCGLGVVDGVNAVIWDPFVSAGKASVLWYKNSDRFWDNTAKEWEAIKDSFFHFDRFVREKYQNYKSMPPVEKSRLYCSFVGGWGAGNVSSKIVKVATFGEKALETSKVSTKKPQNVPGYNLSPSARKALNDLLDYFEEKKLAKEKAVASGELAENEAKGGHNLSIINGRGHVHIGMLTRDLDSKMGKLLVRAYKEGAIAEIDAGSVVGPKVLNLINQLRMIAPKEGPGCRIHGGMNPSTVSEFLRIEIRDTAQGYTKPTSPKYWRQKDIDDFEQASRDLKLEEACLKLHQVASLKECKFMQFEINTQRPSEVNWSR